MAVNGSVSCLLLTYFWSWLKPEPKISCSCYL